ncbi:2-amino-4-hydroxy-6-hydroxymethyldihydropteridine diphosphokinase [Azonexus fungiphilus]|jgi:2-amino-4-hydroxy-6-hydroxymethyldihydropteridine diphosphokinase|uniref:2-amino-4-hydroxy-6- hydroxymethyldihydropteridine diphosphokinase n=1 Tax=Azonexus fungiphilus TaxID=146940 RepID=UPI00156A8CAC|nr:2-amino-4-hydroxy-6-hydroxymethyldihydropteridine diphosphokinase [Azonexus fungiphilus]NHC05158.1 2-amino-4-hydroxy-6-hydroxymethyldihydropteridine diphosphokinase [Azonexus fungiphilus]
MSLAYIALGANLGDPAATVNAAFAALDRLPHSRLLAKSALYRTAPVGIADQPEFVNAAARLETTLAPEALLDALLDIEQVFGRVRAERNGPRTLDLDLLLYDELRLATPRLILPHPRLHLRAFVLQPLAELAPDLALPGRGRLAAWLPAVANQGIRKI